MKWTAGMIVICIASLVIFFATRQAPSQHRITKFQGENRSMTTAVLDTATFGAGCFWCVEAIFQNLKGVQSVVSGYAGGSKKNPTYEEVCSGNTGHAEATQVTYDPGKITYAELLEVFWQVHDPTTPNRQGNDVGTQYRSVIFYHNEEQRKNSEHYRKELDSAGAFDAPIVTEIVPYTSFYRAEDYHQNYFNEHSDQPYCSLVIRPKLDKFKKAFKDKLKSTNNIND